MPRKAVEESEMAVFNTNSEYGSPRHTAICDWLKTHGFDINSVPSDAAIEIDGDLVKVEVYVKDDDGKLVLRDGQAQRIQRTVKLVSDPSALVLGDA